MKYLILPACTAALAGCGALIGNPGSKSTTSTSAGFIKTIDFSIPSSVSGYTLALAGGPDGLFQDSVRRVADAIDRINQLTANLNQTVTAAGTFSGKGPDGKVSMTVAADTGAYDYMATLCEGGKPFQFIEWNSQTGAVHAIRSLGVDPVDVAKAVSMTSELAYTGGDPAAVHVLNLLPAPPGGPPPGLSGSNLGELIDGTKTGAGTFTMTGVHDWADDPTTLAAKGDEYFVGQFDDGGTGETVGFNAGRADICTRPFNEAGTPPNWCTGKDLSGTTYSGPTLASAVQRLASIPVEKHADLKAPALPAGLVCP